MTRDEVLKRLSTMKILLDLPEDTDEIFDPVENEEDRDGFEGWHFVILYRPLGCSLEDIWNLRVAAKLMVFSSWVHGLDRSADRLDLLGIPFLALRLRNTECAVDEVFHVRIYLDDVSIGGQERDRIREQIFLPGTFIKEFHQEEPSTTVSNSGPAFSTTSTTTLDVRF